MSKQVELRNAEMRRRWFRMVALFELGLGAATLILAVPGLTAYWPGLCLLGLAGLFTWLTGRADKEMDRLELKSADTGFAGELQELKSAVADEATWQDLAYGPGSAHHRIQQAIDRIQDELDAPERQLREARSWANHIMGLGADTALRILATQVAIDRDREAKARRAEQERAEAKELEDFIEWMGDTGVTRDGHQGPVSFSRLTELDRQREQEQAAWDHARAKYDKTIRASFAAGGYVQETEETLVYNGLGEVIHPYADGVVYCTDGRRIFNERFVRDYDPMRITHYKCGDHFHKNDGS